MSSDDSEKLIFGRYAREECGLPPRIRDCPGRGAVVVRTALLFAVLVAAGWLGGKMAARHREMELSRLPGRVARAGDPGEMSRLLADGQLLARAIASDYPGAGLNLAAAVAAAAEKSPRRAGYYGNLSGLLPGLREHRAGIPEADFAAELMTAGAYAELGDYTAAFQAADRAEEQLAGIPDDEARRGYTLLLVNTQAYLLATAPEDKGGNAGKALQLAQLMITSRDELPGGGHASGSAAFLDTLASARHAVRDDERALATQAFALGLAETEELEVYLRHYDAFNRDGN